MESSTSIRAGCSHDARMSILPTHFLPRGLLGQAPPKALGHMSNCIECHPVHRDGKACSYLGELFSKAPGNFPFFLVVNFIAEQKYRNTVPHSFLQNIHPPLREAPTRRTRGQAWNAGWRGTSGCKHPPAAIGQVTTVILAAETHLLWQPQFTGLLPGARCPPWVTLSISSPCQCNDLPLTTLLGCWTEHTDPLDVLGMSVRMREHLNDVSFSRAHSTLRTLLHDQT